MANSSNCIFDWIFILVTRTCIKAWLSPKSARYGHSLQMSKKSMYKVVATGFFIFDWILILAGNKDMHKSFNEFVFQLDLTTNYRVSCP